MQLAPAGDRALLVELGNVTAEELHAANAKANAAPGVVKSIPGHSSLYVIFDGAPDAAALRAALQTDHHQPPPTNILRIPTAFTGPDLESFLQHSGQSREEFLARVDALRLTARYLGVRGGFAYLDGWPAEWAMPRRPTSRPVARGSFGIAGSVAAFYPTDTPGGWNILGRTELNLEDRIRPGDVLQLSVTRAADVEADAPLALWTDRPFDDVAASLANRAAGNDPHAPLLECPLVGPKLRATRNVVVAWCTPDLRVVTERLRGGESRAFGRISGGLRAYLAVGEREVAVEAPVRNDRRRIRVLPGPHDAPLGDVECEVTPQLDRVGIRLRPLRALDVKIPADLRSIGMQTGTVQLHPDRSLVAMGPDHPVTGGYLQPMTVLTAERWKLAQLAPGERITFVV